MFSSAGGLDIKGKLEKIKGIGRGSKDRRNVKRYRGRTKPNKGIGSKEGLGLGSGLGYY